MKEKKQEMSLNLLPGFSRWETVTPEWKPLAMFDCSYDDTSASIRLDSDAFGVGKLVTTVPVNPGWYDFTVSCRTPENVNDLYVLLTVVKEDGKMITREHAKDVVKTADGWAFREKTEVPEDGVSICVELWLKGYHAFVEWKDPVLLPGQGVEPRIVKIALGLVKPTFHTLEENGAKLLRVVDKAGQEHPDIIMLSEAMYERGVPIPLAEKAETQDGPMVTAMRYRAKQHHSYLIYNLHEREGTEIYNSSLLIDRAGNIVGKYRKTHLTVSELEMGMTPGKDHPVFDTDFGRIGLLTCWDQYFPEPAKYLVEKGAEIIFVPSAGDAKEKSHTRAMDYGIYLAVCGIGASNTYGWGPVRVVDPYGKIITETEDDESVAFCSIDLNKPVRVFWLSVGPAESRPREVYKYERNPKSYS